MSGLWSLIAQATEPQGFIFWIDRVARAPLSRVLIFAAICTLIRVVVFPYLRSKKEGEKGTSIPGLLNELSDALVYAAIVVFMLVRPFGIQTFFIPSGSMIETLHIQDYIVANKLIYRTSEPKVGDIVVFKPPRRALLPGTGDTDYIKRLVGAPGDVIELREKVLYRNGQPVDEPYVTYTRSGPFGTERPEVMPREQWPDVEIPDFKLVEFKGRVIPLMTRGALANADGGTAPEYRLETLEDMQAAKALPPAPVPPGHFLMMGDNRNGSYDGRGWGLVPRDAIIGRSEFIWLPLKRWGKTR